MLFITPFILLIISSLFRLSDDTEMYLILFTLPFFGVLMLDSKAKISSLKITQDFLIMICTDSLTSKKLNLKVRYSDIVDIKRKKRSNKYNLILSTDEIEIDFRFLKEKLTGKVVSADEVVNEIKSRMQC